MSRYVLDASVAAKWFLHDDEPHRNEALKLLVRYRASEIDFIVPDLFYAEFANIIWKATRLNRCDEQTGDRAIKEILAEPIPVIPSTELIWDAHLLARAFNRSLYDCVYIAAAVKRNAQMVTADKRLANSVTSRLPVTWLGLLP